MHLFFTFGNLRFRLFCFIHEHHLWYSLQFGVVFYISAEGINIFCLPFLSGGRLVWKVYPWIQLKKYVWSTNENFGFGQNAVDNLAQLLDLVDSVIHYICTWLYAIHDISSLIIRWEPINSDTSLYSASGIVEVVTKMYFVISSECWLSWKPETNTFITNIIYASWTLGSSPPLAQL